MKGPISEASTGPIARSLDFEPALAPGLGLSAGIYRSVVDGILGGRLRPGERLPAARDLARRLDVARNTVVAAYDQLVAEGFLVARVGAGTFVADEAPVAVLPRRAPHGRGVGPRRAWVTRGPGFASGHAPARINLSVGVPDAALFPLTAWRRLVASALRPERLVTGYAAGDGDPRLRAAIAGRIGAARSVRAAAGDIVVTNGAQQALDLVARVLLGPDDVAAVEEPGYPPARRVFAAAGAHVAPIPVDREGLVVDALPDDARLVYVTPSHQFPLGMPMSLARRAALLAWARDRGAVVVEDDYDAEFRFGGRPLEPLQAIDRDGRVLYLGSFSKTLLPMLRTGFVVAPASLRPALVEARLLADWHGDPVTQAALAALIDSGRFSRHVRRASRVYAARHALVASALDGALAPWLERVPSSAGLHVAAFVREGADVDLGAVLRRAREAGVRVESLASYAAAPLARRGVVLGFGGVGEVALAEGLAVLEAAFRAEAGDR